MKESIQKKLEILQQRSQEVSALLSEADVAADQNKFRELSKEYAQLEPVVSCYQQYTANQDAIEATEEMLEGEDLLLTISNLPTSCELI